MPLKLCTVLLALAVVPGVALAQPVPVPLPAPIERAIQPRVVVPGDQPTMRLDQEEDQAAYPGYYGWRTYPPSYPGFAARPYDAARPFYGFAYRPSGYTGFYRPFYYRHGFYFRGRPFGYVPLGGSYADEQCGDYDD